MPMARKPLLHLDYHEQVDFCLVPAGRIRKCMKIKYCGEMLACSSLDQPAQGKN